MSIELRNDYVLEVQLADGWHTVKDGSFEIDEREYQGPTTKVDGGVGFRFIEVPEGGPYREMKLIVSGPLKSIRATKSRSSRPPRMVPAK